MGPVPCCERLSDAIEQKGMIDRMPRGSKVRPLIESTVQVALAIALDSLLQKRPLKPLR